MLVLVDNPLHLGGDRRISVEVMGTTEEGFCEPNFSSNPLYMLKSSKQVEIIDFEPTKSIGLW